RPARLAAGNPAGHRAEDPRLPDGARRLQVGRRARRGSGDRAVARGAAPRSRRSVIARLLRTYPYALAGSLCLGLAVANGARVHEAVLVLAIGVAAAGALAAQAAVRVVLVAVALLLGGWWWGSARLDALDSSVLLPHVGEAAPAQAVVTGPARTSTFQLRVPATL